MAQVPAFPNHIHRFYLIGAYLVSRGILQNIPHSQLNFSSYCPVQSWQPGVSLGSGLSSSQRGSELAAVSLCWPLIGPSSDYPGLSLVNTPVVITSADSTISASQSPQSLLGSQPRRISQLSLLSEAGLSAHSSLQPPQQPPSLSCLPGITPQSASSVTTHLEDIIKIVNTQWLPPREVLYPDGRCHLIPSLHSLLSFPPFPWSQWLTLLSSLSS